MKKSIKFTLLAVIVVFSVVLSVSCKKNNPDIAFKTYNLTFTDTTHTGTDQSVLIDIDGDGVKDFKFFAITFSPDENDTIINQIGLNGEGVVNALVDSVVVPNPADSSISFSILRVLESGDAINSSSSYSDEPAAVLRAYKNATLLGAFGINDSADKFIGFKFVIGTDLHYGWLKINLSADKKTLTIKEGAYNSIANEGITAGDK